VFVTFGSNTKNQHMVIVLSPESVNITEEQFLGIMITDSSYYDSGNDYSFPLASDMFSKPLKEAKSRVRLYLITFLPNQCVVGTVINQIKTAPYYEMIKQLNERIFGVIL